MAIAVRTPPTFRLTMNVVPDCRTEYVTVLLERTGTTNDRIDAVVPERASISVGADRRL